MNLDWNDESVEMNTNEQWWRHEQMSKWKNEQMHNWTKEQINKWTSEQINEQMNKWKYK
jgi:hypothetical protein